jgi:hypothetical protein
VKSSFERPSTLGSRTPRLVALLLVAVGVVVAAGAGTGSAKTNANPPTNTGRPTISGVAQVGRVLTAGNGQWQGTVNSYAYQWLRCGPAGGNCAGITGANAKKYALSAADAGNRIRVQVTATNSDGSGKATSDATAVVQAAGTAPVNSARPTISGSASLGSTLSVNKGTWTGVQPISFAYQWQRCDAGGNNNCADISGATGTSYNVVSADVGHTLRVRETAHNAKGTNSVNSSVTDTITPAKGGGIPVAQVNLPNQLVVDRVQFAPQPLGSRRPLTGRFHVSDTRGFSVEGALVYALGLPYGWVANAPEVTTNGSGWATVVFHPTSKLPLNHGTYLVVFVRARKPGENLLSGVSTRRLVQATVK